MRIEFSFDDGMCGDQRAAALLEKYGYRGTFYYPSNPVVQGNWLDIPHMARIARAGHEIGGHTVTHPADIKLLSDSQLDFELQNNKALIEKVVAHKPCTKFAYPRGRHDERVRAAVKKAGFTEARTTLVLNTDEAEDPLRTPTTVHMYARKEYNGKLWLEVAKEQLEIALSKPNSVFHVWGHTNELDLYQEWGRFEELLKLLKLRTS